MSRGVTFSSPRSSPRTSFVGAEFSKFEEVFSQDELTVLRTIFSQLDTRGEGKLRLEDFQPFMEMQGLDFGMDGALEQWHAIDTDGDGFVDAQEFLTWMARSQKEGQAPRSKRPSIEDRSQPSMWDSIGLQESAGSFESVPEAVSHRRTLRTIPDLSGDDILNEPANVSDEDEEDEEDEEEEEEEEDEDGTKQRLLAQKREQALKNDLERALDMLEHERKRRADIEDELEGIYSRDDQKTAISVPLAEYEMLKLEQERAREQLQLLEDTIAESRAREEELREMQAKEEQFGGDRSPRGRPTLSGASLKSFGHAQSLRSNRATMVSVRSNRTTMVGRPSIWSRPSMPFGHQSSGRESTPSGHRLSNASSASQESSDYALVDPSQSLGFSRNQHQILEEQTSMDSDDSAYSEEWGGASDAPGRCRAGDLFPFQKKRNTVEEKLRDDRQKLVAQINGLLGDVTSIQRHYEKHANEVAQDVVKLLQAEPASLAPARAVAERAAVLLVQHQQEILENRNHSLGAQLELADVRDTLCGGLEGNIQDARMALITLKKSLGDSCAAAEEQSRLCENLATHAQLLRSAAASVENTGAFDIHAEALLADSVSECMQTQLAEIHAENAQVVEVLAAMHAKQVSKAGDVAFESRDKDDPVELESELVAEVLGLSAQVDHLAKGLACPMVIETDTVDSDSSSEAGGPIETAPARSFTSFWNAVSYRDPDVKASLQASMRKGEAWAQANGVKSAMEVLQSGKEEMFVGALHLDPKLRQRALKWFEQKSIDTNEQIAHDRLAVACIHRERDELASALEFGRAILWPQDALLQQAERIWKGVRRDAVLQRAKLLDQAYMAAVPETHADVISHIVILPAGSEQCTEVKHICDQESCGSWVTCVPNLWGQDAGVSHNSEQELRHCQHCVLQALEDKLKGVRSDFHVTLAFVTRPQLHDFDSEQLMKVASLLQDTLLAEHNVDALIGACCFEGVRECKRYIEEQEKEQRRLHDIVSRVDALRVEVAKATLPEVDEVLSESDIVTQEELLDRLAVEVTSIGTARTLAELAMRNRQEKLLEENHRKLAKENAGLREYLATEKAALEIAEASRHDKTEEAPHLLAAVRRRSLMGVQERRADIEKLEASSSELLAMMQAKALDAVEKREALARSIRSLVGERQLPISRSTDSCCEAAFVLPTGSTTEEICSAALKRVHRRVTEFSSIRWAGVRLVASLREDVSENKHGEILDQLKDAVTHFLATHLIDVFDLCASIRKSSLSCDLRLGHFAGEIHLFKFAPTVMMTVETLQKEMWSGELGQFWESVDAYDVCAEPVWPLNRIQAELDLKHGYALSRHQLRKMLPLLDQSQRSYQLAWNAILSKSPKAAESLLRTECMARFGERCCKDDGRLLLSSEGAKQGLVQVECRQGVATLSDLLADAAEAQRTLKEALAPGTAWAKAELNDLTSVPLGHPLRAHDCSGNQGGLMVPGATIYDPGIKSAARTLRKAAMLRTRYQAFDVEEARQVTPLDSVLDVSRLGIIFDTARGLLLAAEWILQTFDPMWLTNTFPTPSCLGQRGMNIGIRWVVAASNSLQRVHICELELSLRELYEVHHSDGYHIREEIRSLLQTCGVKHGDLDVVQQTILELLDYTDGKAAQEALKDLRHTMRKVEPLKSAAGDHLSFLIRELIAESTLHAMAVGVPVDEIRAEAAHARSLVVNGGNYEVSDVNRSRKELCSSTLTRNHLSPEACQDDSQKTMRRSDYRPALNSGAVSLPSSGEAMGLSFDQPSEDLVCEDTKAFTNELQNLQAAIADMKAKAENTEELRDAVLHAVACHDESPPSSDPQPLLITPQKLSQENNRSQRWSRWERALLKTEDSTVKIQASDGVSKHRNKSVKVEQSAQIENLATVAGVEDAWQCSMGLGGDSMEVWDLMRRLKLQSRTAVCADSVLKPSRSMKDGLEVLPPTVQHRTISDKGLKNPRLRGRRKLKLPMLSPEQLVERQRQEARLQEIVESLSKRFGQDVTPEQSIEIVA